LLTNDLFYAAEKFHQALDALATGEGVLRERLITACMCNITAHRAHPMRAGLGPKMPAELVERIYDFTDRVTATAAVGNEGTLTATLNAMSDEELRSTAEELSSLSLKVIETFERDDARSSSTSGV